MFTTHTTRIAILHLGLGLIAVSLAMPQTMQAQAPVTANHAAPQRGTVKAIDGKTLTLQTDAGQPLVITVSDNARVQRLAAGSTDLKTAESSALADVAVGDRVLVAGSSGDTPNTFNASRVILMKSADIAQKHEAEQQDWQKRGSSGIVNGVDAATGAITVSSGARKLEIKTTPATSFRRYADGSVKFEDAKPGTLAQIQPGDQMLARGVKSDDGGSLQAEEVVSGSFKNLSGTILSIDAATNSVSLKDLVSKRNVTVQITPNTALHRLPAEAAAMFAARTNAGTHPSGAASPPARSAPGAAESDRPAAGPRRGGGDLSQVVARLPAVTLTDLHTGDAVIIVAEQSSSDAASLTAITLLAGVEPILAASSGGAPAMTLSPWSVGSGSPDAGGSQ